MSEEEEDRVFLGAEGTSPRGVPVQVKKDGTIDLWGYDIAREDWEKMKKHIDGKLKGMK